MDRDRPWLRHYGSVPQSLDYPEVSLYRPVADAASRTPAATAWDFFDRTSRYDELIREIDQCAGVLASLHLQAGDRLLIAMPTCPQAVVAFYAANRLGIVAALIHPLSTPREITGYLDASGARVALALDACYPAFAAATPKHDLTTILLARIPDYLPPLKRAGFWLTKGRRIAPVPRDSRVRWWSDAMARPAASPPPASMRPDDAAAILFSGGTTGSPKGILLSNRNFIAEGMQAAAWGGMGAGTSILAILPIFHGFGLGVCVNAALMSGGTSILVPTFDAATVARLIRTKRPNVLVGVPTLFDALAKDESLSRVDLSCLTACFCGADTLPRQVKERFEALVERGGGRVRLLEGYGLTEAVTAVMAMPLTEYREASIGIPFPDMRATVVVPGTTDPAALGTEGEICISGPAVMLGYLNDPEATATALQTHADGRTWLHTGDIGRMDDDGFFYFTTRLKRMIKSSGFNVYPAQVEAVLLEHPLVLEACVFGVPDPAQIERVTAAVVLKDPALASNTIEQELIAHCRKRLIKWSCPRAIEFHTTLPRTRIGKVDYRTLAAAHLPAPEETVRQ
jgi:long-chain acyl-CoA synthetase